MTEAAETGPGGCGFSGDDVTLVFPCSGAANVGQLANELALRMTRGGIGPMSCLAGVGAPMGGFVVSAKDCRQAVALDGCPLGCAGKAFGHVGIKPHVHLVQTGHRFKKRHDMPLQLADTYRGLELVMANVKGTSCSTAW